MASKSTYSSWPAMTVASELSTSGPSPSPALDFLAAVATLDIQQYDIGQLGMTSTRLSRLDERAIGHGGFAVVDRGMTRENRPVAVKRIRTSAKDKHLDFGRQLRRICLELRILGHPPLKQHPNIVDVVGYCLSESLGVGNPLLALILEFSSLGTLKDFLLDRGKDLHTRDLISFVGQVAAGLHALHTCSVCHGDLKTQNVLVFAHDDKWTVKIADFGESVVASSGDLMQEIELSFGTPLLNAPEVRTRFAKSDTRCSIQVALHTDIFSFGLLVWEVMKRGSSYFEKRWCGESQDVDAYDMQDYLDTLPTDTLLSKACDYVRSHVQDRTLADVILKTLQMALRDDPNTRSSMRDIQSCLNSFTKSIRQPALFNGSAADCQLSAWSTRHNIFQLRDAAIRNVVVLEISLPFEIQELIVAELIILANSESSSTTVRSHAAMCIAECYCFGFGLPYDKQEMTAWTSKAVELGSLRALALYSRISLANSVAPAIGPRFHALLEFEGKLSHLAPELYLPSRIRLQVQCAALHIATSALDGKTLAALDINRSISHFGLFNSWDSDELVPLHVAALLGRDGDVRELLRHSTADLQSHRGFTAIHYACIGGNLSTLQLLLDSEAVILKATAEGITPLHLCIFFSDEEAGLAATILIEKGVLPNAASVTTIYWEYHDVELRGSPLDWATRTRNRSLTKHLLTYAQDNRSLHIAVANYFWEIVQDIVDFAHNSGSSLKKVLLGDDVKFGSIRSPFSHWIAHGAEHSVAVGKTLRVCQDNNICAVGITDDGCFFGITSGIPLEDNIATICYCATRLPREAIKCANENGQTPLSRALERCKNIEVWRAPLEAIMDLYTVKELEVKVGSGFSYLHLAVQSDSILGARLLLERGVDVNQRVFTGDTALSLCRHTNKQMYALLKEFGANDNVPSNAGAGNLIVSNLNRSQAEEGIFQQTLSESHVATFGKALHDTLISVIVPTIRDMESFRWSQSLNDAYVDILLTPDELEALRSKLDSITSDELRNLKLMLSDDQLDLIRRSKEPDPSQHLKGLSLTMKIGEQALNNLFADAMDDVIGEDVTMRLLELYSNHMDSAIEKGDLLGRYNDVSKDEVDPDRSNQMQEAMFKLQLGVENALTCINDVNEAGMTMIQVATYWLHYDSVAALLEAGADASIPLRLGTSVPVYPLQIACAMGRLYVSAPDLVLARLGKYSMKVARELLLWHRARPAGLFAGITELHLACRMLMLEEVDDLRAKGCSDHQKGQWPGMEAPVVCHELTHQLPEDDFFLNYSSLETSRLGAMEFG